MVKCINNCGKNGCHIADGLYLCKDCEANEKFVLVQHIETKEFKWKNIDWALCDEIIVET